jgi:hypothetical protein
MDEISKRLQSFEQTLDAFRQVSEMLKGAVAELEREGWTKELAQQIVVATYANAVHHPPKQQP